MTDMVQIRAQLQSMVAEPIEQLGFFMSKGSFTKPSAGATSSLFKMVSGFGRKKAGGDLVGTSTGQAVWGLDNHQTAVVLTSSRLYAIDTQTGMDRQMRIGAVLQDYARSALDITVTIKDHSKNLVLINLTIGDVESGTSGNLETMAYTNLGDPTYELAKSLQA